MCTFALSKSKLPAKWIMSDAMLAYEKIEPTPPQLGSWELVSSMVTNDLIGTRTKHKQHATFPTGKNSQDCCFEDAFMGRHANWMTSSSPRTDSHGCFNMTRSWWVPVAPANSEVSSGAILQRNPLGEANVQSTANETGTWQIIHFVALVTVAWRDDVW